MTYHKDFVYFGERFGLEIVDNLEPKPGIAPSPAHLAKVITEMKAGNVGIILVGLFNSVMFPTIFTLAIDGLGKLTGQGSGILVMAIVGGAIIPIAQGALADRIGIHLAFILPAVCYLYIVYYGLRGSRHA